jgi:naringenin degradation protein FdeD
VSEAAAGRLLCRLQDIPDGGSAAFELAGKGEPFALMAIRRGGDVRVYVNVCPHWGSPLDITPGQFLDRSGERILCSTHGALFRIDDGRCVKGPCLGASLAAVPCRIEDDLVLLQDRAR